jgi:hypothetical protein
MECSHCAGAVHLDDEQDVGSSSAEQGTDGDKVWCSEVCRQVVVEGKWPSPVGPATHDEILRWIDAQAIEDGRRAQAQQVARARHEAAEQRKFDDAVARFMARKEG